MCKPDGNGCQYLSECSEAFAQDWNGGYQFMSVLTHDLGRGGSMGSVAELPTNVCGFDSETWAGGPTPWDRTGVDWPTTDVDVRDPLKMVWDVSYGPHFGDTQEFVHYITRDDFVFDTDRPLTWDDFEPEPFCVLEHDPNNPAANPLIIPRVGDAEFDTWCSIPPTKTGRHIIYAEWGRNQWTLERFHGCIDIFVIGGDGNISPTTPSPTIPSPPSVSVEEEPIDEEPPLSDTVSDLSSSAGIPYPCCGWNGDCEQAHNTWCHSQCDRCTGACNGQFYTAPGIGSRSCNAQPTSAVGCCSWGRWTTCPEWTKTCEDPVRREMK